MGDPLKGERNFVSEDMNRSLEILEEAFLIRMEISSLEQKLKGLRVLHAKKKDEIMKLVNKSRRNFPRELFDRYGQTLDKAQDLINAIGESKIPHYKPLIPKKAYESRPKITNSKRPRTNKMNRYKSEVFKSSSKEALWKGMRKSILGKLGDRKTDDIMINREKCSRFKPIWSREKPNELRITGMNSESTHPIYDPGYFPNPFCDFMSML